MIEILESYNKILIIKNGKTPLQKWKEKHNQFTEIPDLNNFNYGVLTGIANDLLVLDIDVKDDGLNEWQEYVNKHGEVQTMQISTPSGGIHYYFKFSHSNPEDALLINSYLTNRTKLRGKGIDIRSNGGYVVGPGSSIDGKEYDNKTDWKPIIEIPSTLIQWLLIKEDCKTDKRNKEDSVKSGSLRSKPSNNMKQYQYTITDNQLVDILSMLDDHYLDNYSDWLKVTTILKNLGKIKIWNWWSKHSNNYNKKQNLKIWNNANANIDINYLVKVINKSNVEQIEEVPRFKTYQPLTESVSFKKLSFNQKFVFDTNCEGRQFKYKYFKAYDTIIIKSTTGTGKTTAVANHVERYMSKHTDKKFLTITARQSLSDQHQESFKSINLANYQDADVVNKRASTICVNSLLQLEELPIEAIKKYIIYIDEVASFIEAVTHNETLDGKLKSIYILLMRLIKYADKVVVSDALINDGVLELLRSRDNKLMVNNKFVKYQDVEAIRLRNEHDFLNKMISNVKNGNYFFFGSDSKDIAVKFCNECKKHGTNEDFILITADTPFRITNANEEFKNKFVFYSPKITYGVDFNNLEMSQDVFIYIKGHTIQPSGAFQQATRCRNIKTLYFYGDTPNKLANYDDIQEVKQVYKQNINTCKNLKTLCSYINKDNEEDIVENSFFNLFCYQEYVKDIYSTNKIEHFKDILTQYGFKVVEEGVKKELEKGKKKDMATLKDKINEEVFEEFLKDGDKEKDKYHIINNNVDYLGIQTNEQCVEYKDIIIDNYKVEDHNNIISLLKFDKYINNKLEELKESSYDVKQYQSKFHKIQLLRNIEKKYNI